MVAPIWPTLAPKHLAQKCMCFLPNLKHLSCIPWHPKLMLLSRILPLVPALQACYQYFISSMGSTKQSEWTRQQSSATSFFTTVAFFVWMDLRMSAFRAFDFFISLCLLLVYFWHNGGFIIIETLVESQRFILADFYDKSSVGAPGASRLTAAIPFSRLAEVV